MSESERAGEKTGGEPVACHECDALQCLPLLGRGQIARCHVCHAKLLRVPRGGLDRPIALFSAALILLLVANSLPFMTLDIQGRRAITTIFGASQALYEAGMGGLALAVFLTSIAVPALLILSSLYVLLDIRFALSLPGVRVALSWISHLQPWGMLDVFMLGVLVAFVKLGDTARMHVGVALIAYAGLIVLSAAASAAFEPGYLWRRLRRQRARRAR